ALLLVVLDDAVVHQRHAVADVRVRVGLGDATVRGPAGVADAQVRAEFLGLRGRLHLRHAPGAAHAADVAPGTVVDHGDAGRVVTAVLEALEAFDQDWNHIAIRDRADDAAHGRGDSFGWRAIVDGGGGRSRGKRARLGRCGGVAGLRRAMPRPGEQIGRA